MLHELVWEAAETSARRRPRVLATISGRLTAMFRTVATLLALARLTVHLLVGLVLAELTSEPAYVPTRVTRSQAICSKIGSQRPYSGCRYSRVSGCGYQSLSARANLHRHSDA